MACTVPGCGSRAGVLTDNNTNISFHRYALDKVSMTVQTDEALIPNRPPCLTQKAVCKFLQPLTRELKEVPPCPTIDELPKSVIDHMVDKDKAFWVDKPGANAYELHDAYYRHGMTSEIVKPTPQAVFPRSYQYDLDCVEYRHRHACDRLKQSGEDKVRMKPISAHCRNCARLNIPALTPFQLAWAEDPGQRRWKYYPDLNTSLTPAEIRTMMQEVGRPFLNEACNWYYENYPSVKYDCIIRKFSQ